MNKFLKTILERLKGIFNRNKPKLLESSNMEPIETKKDIQDEENRIENKLTYLKADVKVDNSKYEKEEFMKQLEENPALLENFSIDRLEIILNYYIDENKKRMDLLKKLES